MRLHALRTRDDAFALVEERLEVGFLAADGLPHGVGAGVGFAGLSLADSAGFHTLKQWI